MSIGMSGHDKLTDKLGVTRKKSYGKLPEVTPDHITRAKRMIGCGLDVEEVSQWLANDDALRDKIKDLEEQLDAWRTGQMDGVR